MPCLRQRRAGSLAAEGGAAPAGAELPRHRPSNGCRTWSMRAWSRKPATRFAAGRPRGGLCRAACSG